MSFRCGLCGKSQPAGTKPVMIMTKAREINLPPLQKQDPETGMFAVSSRMSYDIVEEKPACPSCAKTPVKPEVVDVI